MSDSKLASPHREQTSRFHLVNYDFVWISTKPDSINTIQFAISVFEEYVAVPSSSLADVGKLTNAELRLSVHMTEIYKTNMA